MSKFGYLFPMFSVVTILAGPGCAMEEGPITDTTDGGSAGGGYYENLPGNSGDGGSGGDGGTTDGGCDTGLDGGTTDGGTDGDGGSDGGGTDGGASDGGTTDGGSDGGGTTDGGTTDGGTTDGGSSETPTVSGKLGLRPQTTWDVGTTPSTPNPEFNLWKTANVTTAYWDDFGTCDTTTTDDTTTSNGWVETGVTYTPGNILAVNGDWHDGVRDRYLAEAGGVVNILTAEGCDHKRLVIVLDDDTVQVYSRIVGDYPDEEGEAGWVSNGRGGGDLYVYTYSHGYEVTDGCP